MQENTKKYLLILALVPILLGLGAVTETYFNGQEPQQSGFKVEGIEKGQSFDGETQSQYYMIELENGSRFHYWRQNPGSNCSKVNSDDCNQQVDKGYVEISADLSYFTQSESKYEGLDYLSDGEVCAREITSTSIELYRC